MSTPIEIVRAHASSMRVLDEQEFGVPPELHAALASVLADAERFQALELALTDDKIFVSTPDPYDDDLWAPHDGPLSELADRLREGAT